MIPILLSGSLFITPPLLWVTILFYTRGVERRKFIKNTFKKWFVYLYIIYAVVYLYLLNYCHLLK